MPKSSKKQPTFGQIVGAPHLDKRKGKIIQTRHTIDYVPTKPCPFTTLPMNTMESLPLEMQQTLAARTQPLFMTVSYHIFAFTYRLSVDGFFINIGTGFERIEWDSELIGHLLRNEELLIKKEDEQVASKAVLGFWNNFKQITVENRTFWRRLRN